MHVESAMSPHEDGFLEALEAETTILQKRVLAASSRCLLVSCFLSKKQIIPSRGKKDHTSRHLVFNGGNVYSCSCLMRAEFHHSAGIRNDRSPLDEHGNICIETKGRERNTARLSGVQL